ncbi:MULTISPECIES: acyl-CoA dehydrogenase family protein [Rhodococcus]|uniref:Acyl-[acyl-carrier-protein] dehydrogenase MbtN n=1 Tax=Rhodococcus oxybenzonivorans TaxID=1990687 RepID=A0AAE4V6S3_9NOCA|nr:MULTISPECIES: acyl-CoA dehydrogenase family protein [Rhodococcus]MDV7242696.1 acyl-CoA dehydrogenase family protein [Rhodococcus oxybenzonivorans]MDV7268679.1 acyl-CoA dehydrogenase family protein [Rhodococcus oxybenzonivorans]MDV7276129.1 acyl-CoA dehydrogenase family protein [Rhodococcus oxybenzonivorans]MDV7332184.1 acyl-CoA dehydrogenase family protein [Rhodococcus oxybenzonivorans]MDV7344389.1 acyl-CoA dehydrogenase family protein [Rhodococcus oxybenzonivorans]
MRRSIYTPEHEAFRSAFRALLDREAVPNVDKWEQAGTVDRDFITTAAKSGYLGFEFDPEFGGLGISDFRYNAVMTEEVVRSGMAGDTFSMQNDIIVPYLRDLTTDEQKQRWLPKFTRGECVTALGMTEPGAGSDLASIRTSAVRDGDDLIINGTKTFITSGATCDLVIVLVRTGERDGRGTSFVVVENGTPGFERGRPMHKIGRKAQDTAELVFTDCRVPVANIVGEPGRGFGSAIANLPRERLSIAVSGVASAAHALGLALDHVRSRVAFGAPLADLQSVRMAIAEMHTDIQVLQHYVDGCVEALVRGDLTADDAAGIKYKATELQWEVVDRCLQLFGGYGYMEEYPIARIWRDARIQRIYGGANEVMKDLVGRAVVAQ